MMGQDLTVDPIVDESTGDQTAFKREDGTRVTVGQVAEAQARLLDLIAKRARKMMRSGSPAVRGSGIELLDLMRLPR